MPLRNSGEPQRHDNCGNEHVVLLALAAERLRHAARAQHYVPAQLDYAAGWLELAATVHAGELGCEWCARGCCPAVETARCVLGDPPPELLARRTRPTGGGQPA